MKYPIILFPALILLSSCGPSKKEQPAGPAEFRIAYNVAVEDSVGEVNYEVFSMNTDGSDKKNITNNRDVAWTYLAAGGRLFFISDRDTCYRCFFLHEMDAFGNQVKRISDLQLEDSWMDARNDGSEVIVSGRVGKKTRYQLYLINTQTGTYNQVTTDTAAIHRDPSFSPDGQQVAFAYRTDRRSRTQLDEIYVINIDGSGMKQLSHYPEADVSRNANGYKAGATHWHPTENYITYISMQGGRHNIFSVAPDGSNQMRLTQSDFTEGWHDWSPDGKWLVFDSSNKEETQYHIMLMNWETKEVTQLTDTTYHYQQSPVFVSSKR